MNETPWYRHPALQEVIRQVVIALLLALLSVLGYDRLVAEPRLRDIETVAVAAVAETAVAATPEPAYPPAE
jgi:hypothetical protein